MANAMAADGSLNKWMPALADLAWGAAMIATVSLYYAIGSLALSVALLALLTYLCWRRTGLAVSLVPLAIPYYSLPKHLHHGLDFSLGETVIVLCGVVVALQLLLGWRDRPPDTSLRRYLLPDTPFLWPATAFLAAATLALLAAQFHKVALREYREVVLEPMLFYWLVLQTARGLGGAARLLLSLIGSAVVVSGMALVEIAFRPHDLVVAANEGGAPKRLVQAVFQDQNSLALLIDHALPIALALALLPAWARVWTRGRQGAQAAPEIQAGLLAAAALLLYVLYRTGSRGGELTATLCMGFLFVYWQRRRPWVIGTCAVIAVLAALVERHKLQDFASSGHGLSNLAHTSIWRSALNMIRDHPIVGVGPDNFLYYYSNDSTCAPGHVAHWYYVQAGSNFERCINHPHNLFLDFWLSTGVVGLAAAMWLIVLFAILGVRGWLAAPDEWRGPLLAALLVMAAMVVHGEVDNSYFLPDLSVIFWLCLGVVTLWERRTA